VIRELTDNEVSDIIDGLRCYQDQRMSEDGTESSTDIDALCEELNFSTTVIVVTTEPKQARESARIPRQWYLLNFDAIAHTQGWSLFERSDGRIAIQRVDDTGIFDSDEEAYQFVRGMAHLGGTIAKMALELDQMHNTEE